MRSALAQTAPLSRLGAALKFDLDGIGVGLEELAKYCANGSIPALLRASK